MKTNGVEELIFYGDDIKIGRFPEETRFFYANPPMEPVSDYLQSINHALDNPIGAEPIEKQLNSKSRVTIAFDDLCLPIPMMFRDLRGIIIEELLRRLFNLGIPKDRIQLICGNGLHRKWTSKELSMILGKKVMSEMGRERICCHDGTKSDRLIYLGSDSEGNEVEINRAVDESDMTIYVNDNFTSMNGGWKSVLVGLGSWRSIRHHHSPNQWNGKDSIMDPDCSPMHQAFSEMSRLVKNKYNIFQIETVINNRVWPIPVGSLLSPFRQKKMGSLKRTIFSGLLGAASIAPQSVKRMVRNSLRSGYALIDVHAGQIDQIHPLTLDKLYAQQNVRVNSPVDILVFGVPNLSPYSIQSIFNPILLRSLVLGYMRGMYHGQSLVKKGGVIIAANPGFEKFHEQHHPSYVDFWNNDLDNYNDPESCWEALSEPYANNPEYLEKYRNHFAYHGTHCLINWMWSGMALRHVKRVILAGSKSPDVARKLSFQPAKNLSVALDMAKDIKGRDATIGYQVMPPLFCADVGGIAK